MSHDVRPQDIARFWSKVDVRRRVECWEWRGLRLRGYGQFKMGRRMHRAHRIAWTLFKGEIAQADLVVCHHCDNPPCCNPNHLFLGSVAENWRDSYNKGRRVHAEDMRRGGNSNWARLNEEQVIAIRELHAKGNITQTELAKRFNVCRPNIHHIVTRKTWPHI
jgi:hypothetical protein